MPVSAGQTATAAQWNLDTLGGTIIARGRRTSNSSTSSSTTPTGVLRLDDIPLTAGRAYMVMTSSLVLHSSTANDVVRAGIYYTTDGSTPTGSSTLMDFVQEAVDITSNPPAQPIVIGYFPAGTETLSVLLAVSRQTGAGAADLLGSSTFPIDIYVIDRGEDPGSTGTSL